MLPCYHFHRASNNKKKNKLSMHSKFDVRTCLLQAHIKPTAELGLFLRCSKGQIECASKIVELLPSEQTVETPVVKLEEFYARSEVDTSTRTVLDPTEIRR